MAGRSPLLLGARLGVVLGRGRGRKGRVLAALVSLAASLAAQQKPPFAPSEELNRRMPGWLRFGGEYRARLEGFKGGQFREGFDDAYLLGRLRLNMKVQPAGWLSFSFQGQDSRAWRRDQRVIPNGAQDSLDLRMAYAEFGNCDTRPFGLRIGRQELTLGDQRLVGAINWSNTARTFDAVRATLRRRSVRLDAFAASVVVVRDGEFNKRVDGDNLHGLYAVFDRLIPKATLDVYSFWRLAPRRVAESGAPGNLDSKTAGFRWTGKLPRGFDYTMQVAGQTGSLGTDHIRAWAGEWVAGRTWTVRWTPRVSVEYNHASGDRDPRDGRRGTFDTLYPTPHDVYGLADQVGWKNIRHLRSGLEAKPRTPWRLFANYHSWWRASLQDGLYNAAGSLTVRSPGPRAGRHVGQELDFQAFYTLNARLQMAGGVGHIFPGHFLERASPGAPHTYRYVLLLYSF